MKDFFKEQDLSMLLDLFHVYSPTDGEDSLEELIKKILTSNKIEFTQDDQGNIFNINSKGDPLLSAHMDCVGDKECGWYVKFIDIYDYGKDKILKGFGNIGADDKCGVFLILMRLLNGGKVNFVFSIGEERTNPNGINHAIESMKNSNEENWSSIPYAIVLDRKNFGDIICFENSYGTKEFDEALETIGKNYHYNSVKGGFSDTAALSKYMNAANLSTAYFNPHQKTEFVSLNGLFNTWKYLNDIIENLPRNIKNTAQIKAEENEKNAAAPIDVLNEPDSMDDIGTLIPETEGGNYEELHGTAPNKYWTLKEIFEYNKKYWPSAVSNEWCLAEAKSEYAKFHPGTLLSEKVKTE